MYIIFTWVPDCLVASLLNIIALSEDKPQLPSHALLTEHRVPQCSQKRILQPLHDWMSEHRFAGPTPTKTNLPPNTQSR